LKALTLIEKFIFRSPFWKLVSVISLFVIVKSGIWYIPNLDVSRSIAENPFSNSLPPIAHYLYWNWLGSFGAWLIGATGQLTFFLFHLAFSLAFTALFIKLIFSRLSDRNARISLVIFTTLPVSATVYFWVSTDSITLFLMVLALLNPKNLFATLLVGIGLGTQHFEQAFFGVAGLLVAITLSNRQGDDFGAYSIRCFSILLFGTLVGKLVLFGIFKYNNVEVNLGRTYFLSEHFSTFLSQFFFHFQYIIWSVLGLGWLVALKYLDYGRRSLPFFLTLFGLMMLLPISGDQTRVLGIVTFLLVSVYWLLNAQFLDQISDQQAAGIFLIWILMPWSWVWGGVPRWSIFPYDVAFIFHELFGWFNVPAEPAMWPLIN